LKSGSALLLVFWGRIHMLGKRLIRAALTVGLFGAALVAGTQAPAAKEVQPVKIEKPLAWKGVTQVVIGQFSIAFFTKKIDYDGGGFLSGNSKAKATGYLTGMSNAQYQAIVDAAYADFVKQLGQQGITIASDAGFRADPYYAKVKGEEQGKKADVILRKGDNADAMTFWPAALGRTNNVLLNLRLMDRNMVDTYTAEYNYAKTSGIPVLNVVYFVDFAKPAKSEAGGLLQSVKVSAGLAISPYGTQFALMGTDGKLTRMLLQVPFEEGGDFATIKETTSGLSKAVHVAGVLGGGLFGGKSGGMSAKFDYSVTDPKAYSNGVLAASAKTSELLTRQMAGLR
jgi:hypothetical protein